MLVVMSIVPFGLRCDVASLVYWCRPALHPSYQGILIPWCSTKKSVRWPESSRFARTRPLPPVRGWLRQRRESDVRDGDVIVPVRRIAKRAFQVLDQGGQLGRHGRVVLIGDHDRRDIRVRADVDDFECPRPDCLMTVKGWQRRDSQAGDSRVTHGQA